jgi:TM2 domain-containing membrane protein YozV
MEVVDPNTPAPPGTADTKACPYCGEEIKKVAIRCKHCQADLTKIDADFNRGAPSGVENPSSGAASDDFEVRMLEFAYKTTGTINVASVAHALKLPTVLVNDRLEEMAARDVIVRDIDDEGNVFFTLPGKLSQRMPAHPPLSLPTSGPPARAAQHAVPQSIGPPAEGVAVTALVLNVLVPGVGSLVAGRVGLGVGQLLLWVIGLPLCFVLIGFPMVLAAWIWSLVSGIQILEDSKRRQSSL